MKIDKLLQEEIDELIEQTGPSDFTQHKINAHDYAVSLKEKLSGNLETPGNIQRIKDLALGLRLIAYKTSKSAAYISRHLLWRKEIVKNEDLTLRKLNDTINESFDGIKMAIFLVEMYVGDNSLEPAQKQVNHLLAYANKMDKFTKLVKRRVIEHTLATEGISQVIPEWRKEAEELQQKIAAKRQTKPQ